MPDDPLDPFARFEFQEEEPGRAPPPPFDGPPVSAHSLGDLFPTSSRLQEGRERQALLEDIGEDPFARFALEPATSEQGAARQDAFVRGTVRGVTTGTPATAGMLAGAHGGSLGFAAGPIVGTATTIGGGILGLIGGYKVGTEVNELLPRGMTFQELDELPEDVRPFAVAGETMGGAIPFAASPIALSKAGVRLAPTKVGNYVNRILDYAGRRPVLFSAREVPGVISAGVAGGIAEQQFPGDPAVRFGAEVGAGFLNPTRLLIGVGERALRVTRQLVDTFSPATRQGTAARFLQEWVEAAGENGETLARLALNDPDLLKELGRQAELDILRDLGRLDEGELPGVATTVGQKLHSQAIDRFEVELAEIDRAFGQQARREAEDSIKALTNILVTLRSTGDPRALRAAAELRRDFYRDLLNTRTTAAERKAVEAAQRISGDVTASRIELSQEVAGILDASLRGARAQERVLWNAVDKTIPVDGQPLFVMYGRIRGEMTPRAFRQLPEHIRGTVSDLRAAQGVLNAAAAGREVNPAELAAAQKMFTTDFFLKFRTDLLDAARRLDPITHSADRRRLGLLAESVLKVLDDGFKNASGRGAGVIDTYDAARTYSRELNDAFTRSFVGTTRSTSATGAERLPPELLLQRAVAGGPDMTLMRLQELDEATQFLPMRGLGGQEAIENAAAMFDAQHRFLRLSAQAVVDPETGRVSTQRLAKFLKDNAALIDRFPDELQNDLRAALTSEQARKNVERMVTTASRKLENETAFGRILGVDSPADAVRGALSSPRPLLNLVRMERLAQRGGPEAMQGFRTAIWSNAIREATRGDGSVSLRDLATALTKPIRPGLPTLVEFMQQRGLMGDRDISLFKLVVQRALAIDTALGERAVGAPITGGGAEDIADSAMDALLSFAGARAGSTFATGAGAGTSIMAASRGASFFRQVFGRVPRLKVRHILTDAFAGEPLRPGDRRFSLFAALLRQPVTVTERLEIAQQIHAYAVSSGYVALGEADVWDAMRSPFSELLDQLPEPPEDTLEDEAADEAAEQSLLGPLDIGAGL